MTTCRTCYAATLTPAQRERLYAEPVTMPVYLCPKHQRLMDEITGARTIHGTVTGRLPRA